MSGYDKDLYDSLGALYLGATMTVSLWGIATLQVYYYYSRYLKDTLWIKLLVFLVWAFDTVHQALVLKSVYTYLVTNYNNPQFLANIDSSMMGSTVFGFLVTEIVHLFLLFRIWLLSKKNIKLVMIIAIIITMEIIISIYLTKIFTMKQYADIKPYAWLEKLCFSIMATTDTLVALTLIILLHRSRTGFKKSDNIINHLMVFTVNTGAIPSILSLLAIVTIIVYPNSLIWVFPYLLISKVYTNTFLATLNAREYDATMLRSTDPESIPDIRKATENYMSMAAISHRDDIIRFEGLKPKALDLKAASADVA